MERIGTAGLGAFARLLAGAFALRAGFLQVSGLGQRAIRRLLSTLLGSRHPASPKPAGADYSICRTA